MINHNKVTLLLSAISMMGLTNLSFAKMHEYETTHMKSTAGAAAGSLLLEESAFYNPASITFFNLSSIYAQRDSLRTTDNQNGTFPDRKNYGFVLSQGDSNLAGTFSYITQREDEFYRKRFAVSMSSQTSNVSSFGVSIRKSEDINDTAKTNHKYYQTVFGVTHALSETTSVGVIAYDAFKSYGGETKAIVGIQQGLLDYINGTVDIGADYTAGDISKKILLKAGLQVRLLDDFYLRFGGFNDKIRQEKGEGFGIGWVQPKLAFEFAIKNTRSSADAYQKSKKETSFSVSLRGF